MKRLTASRAALFTKCLYWLRDDAIWDEGARGAGAIRGSSVHRFIELYLSGTPGVAALEQCLEGVELDQQDKEDVRAMCVAWLNWAERGEHELARMVSRHISSKAGLIEPMYVWDPRTNISRFVGCQQGRNYPEDSIVGGSADFVLIGEDIACIIDWKTVQPFADVPEALEQLYLLALLVRKVNPQVRRFMIASVGIDVNVVRLGTFAQISAFDLAGMEREITKQIVHPPDAMQPQSGPHCYNNFCPARKFCPATAASVSALAPVSTAHALLPVVASDEQADWTFDALKLAGAQLDDIKTALKEYIQARGGMIPRSNGRMLGFVEKKGRRSFSNEQAVELLRAKGATDDEIASLWGTGKPYLELRETKR